LQPRRPTVLHPALEPSAQEGHRSVGGGPEEATKMKGWNISAVRKG